MNARGGQAGAGDGRQRWQRRYDESRVRDADFSTLSGLEVDPVYGPAPGAEPPGFDRIGWPGEYPFTRGLYPTGYRGPGLDDPPVLRVRQRGADQRAVQDAAARPGAPGCRSPSTCPR